MQMGKIAAIYIAANTDEAVLEKQSVKVLPNQGIIGDRYFLPQQELVLAPQPLRKEDLSLIAAEELQAFNEKFALQIPFGDFRRNIITSGIDLNALVGKKFRIGSALSLGMEFCEPCSKLARTVNTNVLPHLVRRAGLRAAILEPGEITRDDKILEIKS